MPSANNSSRWIQSLPSRPNEKLMQPRAFTTRCQGTAEGKGKRRSAHPTCLARPAAPSKAAIWP